MCAACAAPAGLAIRSSPALAPQEPENVADRRLKQKVEELCLAVLPHLGLLLFAFGAHLGRRFEDEVLDRGADTGKPVSDEGAHRVEDDNGTRDQRRVDVAKDELDQVEETIEKHRCARHGRADVDPDLRLADFGEDEDDDPLEALAQVERDEVRHGIGIAAGRRACQRGVRNSLNGAPVAVAATHPCSRAPLGKSFVFGPDIVQATHVVNIKSEMNFMSGTEI